MSIDPFFSLNKEAIESDKQTLETKTGLFGFYLCSFDITRGLQILYSSPKKMQKSQEELDILKTHCIWKMEKIPLRVDLKFSDFIYSAFQLHDSLDEEITATLKRPLYGIVVKINKKNRPIPSKLLLNFKSKIEKEVGSKLKVLSTRKAIESNPIKREKYKKLSNEALYLYNHLKQMWDDFKMQILDNIESFPNTEDTTLEKSSLLPQDAGSCATNYFKKSVSIRTISTEENPDQIFVMLVNQKDDLKDVIIHVSKTFEFFSETIWVQELPEWPVKEELVLEFSKSEIDENYLIKISSRKTTVDIKSIEIKARV